MAELMTGKLIYKGEGNNRKRHLVFTTKNGKTWDQPINPALFSESLRSNTEAEIEVVFELEASGRPHRIRPAGEEWKEAPSPTAPSRPVERPRFEPGRRDDRRDTRRDDRYTERREPQFKLLKEFHNPYNFIPAPPRKATGTDLDDKEPAGHDRYYEDLWSGRITVKLTTQTPLLIPDAARARPNKKEKDHRHYPTRVDAEDNPYLPPTSIKGMLRAAYEAVTNSRMGVFENHQDRLAYRMAAKVGPVPARVENGNGQLHLRLMPANVIGYAAKLPRYEDSRRPPRDKGESYSALKYPGETLPPQHGDPVWVRVDRSVAREIRRRTDNSPPPAPTWQAGWVCVTGPNINRKRYERVFLESPSDRRILITPKHKDLWRELIQNYKDEHVTDLRRRKEKKKAAPQDYLGDKPGETGWSRHVYVEGAEKLCEGTLCYVEFVPGSNTEIAALIPVTISRRLYAASPDALLPESLKPAPNLERLSPAERVFGWVNQNGAGAYRGNLRISPAVCQPREDGEHPLLKFGEDGVPLAILGQPKPQQARFYAAQSNRGEAQPDGLSKEDAGYLPNKGLRGRKVYPHHAGLPEGYWKDPLQDLTQQMQWQGEAGFFQEYRRPHKPSMAQGRSKLTPNGKAFELLPPTAEDDNEQRDDQNRSVLSWVKPQTVFEFEIEITNLSRVELGALLWLLELPADHFHRLGGGKPLGFGSVSLAIKKTELRDGRAWKTAYTTFDEAEDPGWQSAQSCIDDFKREIANAYGNGDFERAPFIEAFRRCAQGFNKPIHYPRALQLGQVNNSTIPPHPEGKAFEWFVANERTGKQGGPKLALSDLVNDEGLPILEAR